MGIKIGVFMNDLNGGGAEKMMVEFINYICKTQDAEVILIVVQNNGPYMSLLNPKVNIVVLNSGIYMSIFPLYSYLKRNRVDVIYSTLIKPNLISLIVGRLLNIKIIIRIANTIKEYDKSKKSIQDDLAQNLGRYLYSTCHKCIAISEIVKKDLLEFTKIAESKINVIYNPVIIIDNKKTNLIEKDIFHVAIVSRLTAQKNIKTVCSIMEYFIKKSIGIKFHFFGEGKDRVLIENLCNQYQNHDIAEIHGFDISYYSYVKEMQVFLHLPLWEGLGNSVLEVFNSGIPMILSNVESGYSELIKSTYSNIHYFHPTEKALEISELIEKYIAGQIRVDQSRIKLDITKEQTFESYIELI